ncbi:MAG: hypothetical protein R6U96_19415 [Promethearchaeia archaeon]
MTESENKTLKEELISLIKKLPEDITLDDVMYHLYVKKKVLKALEASNQGKTYNHEQVKEQSRKWLQ